MSRATVAVAFTLLVMQAACSSVPGETTAARSMQGDISERVLRLSREDDPGCRQHRIENTEMLEVNSDGTSAQERWVVQSCGRRSGYVVNFSPRRTAGAPIGFSVRRER